MRTIKFRAWDGSQMCEWRLYPNPETENDISYRFVGEDGFCYPWEHPDLIKLQFTGLLDKNGKEIYEGDIVKIIHVWQGRIHTGEVYCTGYGFNVKGVHFTHYDNPTDAFSEGTNTENVAFEIIGNIHQDKHLL